MPIQNLSPQSSGKALARYVLTIEPWLAFLGQNRDSHLFQERSVIDIVDEVLSGWQGQGKLVPAWR